MEERILAVFAERPGQFVSGEQLSELLGCSRTAVWKHIQQLRNNGYTFEAVSRRGYRLIEKPDRLSAAALLSSLETNRMGRTLKLFDEVESTQSIAHKLAEEGAEEGALVIAELQTSGRGRMGRSWHSPKGKGIYMSLLLRPRIPLHFTPQLTLLVVVAVCRAIRIMTGVQPGIKWPNDLLIDGKKICGILLESKAEDERVLHVIAGIGISANLDPADYPEELRSVGTSLKIAAGREIDRTELICHVLRQLESLYELYHDEGFEPVRTAWEALTITLGKPIRTRTPAGPVEGVAESIDEMGALIVRKADGTSVKLYSAEI